MRKLHGHKENTVAVSLAVCCVSCVAMDLHVTIFFNACGNRVASSLVNDVDNCIIIRKSLDSVFNVFPIDIRPWEYSSVWRNVGFTISATNGWEECRTTKTGPFSRDRKYTHTKKSVPCYLVWDINWIRVCKRMLKRGAERSGTKVSKLPNRHKQKLELEIFANLFYFCSFIFLFQLLK
jgi:hypothetical protein